MVQLSVNCPCSHFLAAAFFLGKTATLCPQICLLLLHRPPQIFADDVVPVEDSACLVARYGMLLARACALEIYEPKTQPSRQAFGEHQSVAQYVPAYC